MLQSMHIGVLSSGCVSHSSLVIIGVPQNVALTKWTIVQTVLSGDLHGFDQRWRLLRMVCSNHCPTLENGRTDQHW